ncbi:MAG TPA: acetyl-CoA hydrolase/transferase C-terminal domain-containing protein [Candidatus Sulfopaludibacter sp.]|jgi:acyl-CoA hydrolase|nr:acetyl-CoA hydrolase/transferase C-terminal domain-containing protein [Candidatus Sulfopaludibacter sp.]
MTAHTTIPTVTAGQALEAVQSGHRVYIHNGCSEPLDLVLALTRRSPEVRDVEVLHMATMGIAPYAAPEHAGHFRHSALFIAGNVRQAVREGRADYTPIFLSEIEGLFESGALPIDVCLLQCSPPDAYGYMSLGPSVDVSRTAALCARRVIVEINPRVPRTHGDTFLHVSKVHAFVETDHPLVDYPMPQVTDDHRAIGRRIANLIPDGATLQTGIGGIPEATLQFLGNHRNLGFHSEMIPEGVLELIESGVMATNRRLVAGFALGSKRLFDFMHDNPLFELHPTAYANDPFRIAQNERMVAINSAIEVDLTGQVCSDSMGRAPYSGIGGQIDFLRGAARSKGGLPIIALPSTAKGGTVSRIVPILQPGAGVVTSRGDVHYVITEQGVAYLHGKTLRQRAEALIRIAHPKFQAGLQAELTNQYPFSAV